LASLPPEGSLWARELHAFADQVARDTEGKLKVKLFLGGIAGDELVAGERIRRGQLDGMISGGAFCGHIMPSMHVNMMPGLILSREEASMVNERLRPTLIKEAERAGFAFVGTFGSGPMMVFTRSPMRDLTTLRETRLWAWEDAAGTVQMLRALGLTVVPMSFEQAARAYDQHRVDGFITMPQAALAWQWSAQTRYVSTLRIAFFAGCSVIALRAFDRLPIELQQKLRAAGARALAHVEETGGRQDELLLGELFARQGLRTTQASDSFRAAFFDAARTARAQLSNLVPASLVDDVTRQLVDYHAEHGAR
jgi:TRAP-type C4-dicarboxylate transport system substrate-binding protein